MKNVLLMITTILLAVLTVIIMVKGINIANVELLSINQIKESYSSLNDKSTDASNLNSTQYKVAAQKLSDAQKELESNKKDYLEIASQSTEEEIKEASQSQVYTMEYIWSKIGNYATEEGVQLKMDVVETENSDKSTLEFSTIGYYKSISNFVYNIEQDKNFNFRIQNFKIIDFKVDEKDKDEEYKESLLQASFIIDGVEIKKENVTTQVEIEEETKEEKDTEENKDSDKEK